MSRSASRRRFLRLSLNTAALSVSVPWVGVRACADEPRTGAKHRVLLDGSPEAVGWLKSNVGQPVAAIAPRKAAEIDSSPFSVGFETLDRRMFDPQPTYQKLAELGVKWARAQTGWARTETTRGSYDFTWLDDVVDNLRAVGVTPWFNLGYGNRLYTPDAPDDSAVGWVPVHSEEAMRAWLAYVAAAARHYRDRVLHWEIWNEPNITNFWKPRSPDAGDYIRLVRETAAVIRREISQAVIIGGALAGMPTDYLRKALEAGLGKYVDKISYHPYRAVPEANYRPALESWRELIARHNPDIELWQGENGCPSRPGSAGALGDRDWNQFRQAKWALRRTLYDRLLGVELTSYFHLVDLLDYNWGHGPSGKGNYKGLLHGEDYTPKLSYFAYQRLCSLFDHASRRTPESDAACAISHNAAGGEGKDGTGADVPLVGPAAFVRNGAPLWCFWQLLPPEEDNLPELVNIQINDTPGSPLRTPVLIDMLSGKAFRVAHGQRTGEVWRFADVPVPDYPMILADLRALDSPQHPN